MKLPSIDNISSFPFSQITYHFKDNRSCAVLRAADPGSLGQAIPQCRSYYTLGRGRRLLASPSSAQGVPA